MKWIPVTESLPDSDTTVMTFVAESNEPIWPGYHDGYFWYGLNGEIVNDETITHWMAFPEPPDNKQSCLWTPWDVNVYDSGTYETECGTAHCFIEGDVRYNDHKCCPYCGKEILVLPVDSGDVESTDGVGTGT